MLKGNKIEDIPVGETAVFSKTVGESDVYLFAGITGDLDPNHVDEEFCKKTPFKRRIAHGALIVGYMSTTSTMITQGFERPILSLGYDRIRFIKPVFIGDTITVTYRIAQIDVEKERTISNVEVTNQNGDLVAVATHIQKLI
jgi:3-hydroxybutyryl-CoA dehydratase